MRPTSGSTVTTQRGTVIHGIDSRHRAMHRTRLASVGWDAAITGRNASAGSEVLKQMASLGALAYLAPAPVEIHTLPATNLRSTLFERQSPPDGLVDNAAVCFHVPIERSRSTNGPGSFLANLAGPFLVASASLTFKRVKALSSTSVRPTHSTRALAIRYGTRAGALPHNLLSPVQFVVIRWSIDCSGCRRDQQEPKQAHRLRSVSRSLTWAPRRGAWTPR